MHALHCGAYAPPFKRYDDPTSSRNLVRMMFDTSAFLLLWTCGIPLFLRNVMVNLQAYGNTHTHMTSKTNPATQRTAMLVR